MIRIASLLIIVVTVFAEISKANPLPAPFMRLGINPGIAAYTRAAVIQKGKALSKIVYQQGGALHVATVPNAQNLASVSEEDQINAFISEARFNLKLAAQVGNQDLAPAYYALIQKLKLKLAKIEAHQDEISKSRWKRFVRKMNSKIAFHAEAPGSKVSELARYHRLIQSVLNPSLDGRDLGSHTLIVPLSMEWFRSSPELYEYFQHSWIKPGRFDVRILGGNSGEGISGVEKDQYLKNLITLRKAITRMGDPKLLESAEYQWLTHLSSKSLAKFDRLIFIHEFTWRAKNSAWQDYIAVDQGFGPIRSHPLLSVLIHEINVNSYAPSFLPQDSHVAREWSEELWRGLDSKRLIEINRSPLKQSRALGLQPMMGVIYLGMIIPELEKELD